MALLGTSTMLSPEPESSERIDALKQAAENLSTVITSEDTTSDSPGPDTRRFVRLDGKAPRGRAMAKPLQDASDDDAFEAAVAEPEADAVALLGQRARKQRQP